MGQDRISSCKADISRHGRSLCLHSLLADLDYKLITDAQRLLPDLMGKYCMLRILHIIIAVHTALDLYKCGSDIGHDIFNFSDIDVSQKMPPRALFVGGRTVDLDDLVIFQEEGPYLALRFFNQNFSLHLAAPFPSQGIPV